MEISHEIIETEDGSQTLRHPVLGDTYHSLRGAVGEAEHVFIRAGFDYSEKDPVKILEVGFGSGLNALLTLRRSIGTERRVEYHALELYPVGMETILRLNYLSCDDPLQERYLLMHSAPWNKPTLIGERFSLKKIKESLVDTELDTIFDVIFFDAFAPDTQPELWSETVFRKLYEHTAEDGILVTYSSKGDVKRALRNAGYEVVRLQGALGKRHMLRAHKRKKRE